MTDSINAKELIESVDFAINQIESIRKTTLTISEMSKTQKYDEELLISLEGDLLEVAYKWFRSITKNKMNYPEHIVYNEFSDFMFGNSKMDSIRKLDDWLLGSSDEDEEE